MKGAFLVKGGKFCTSCCSVKSKWMFVSASIAVIDNTWYTATFYHKPEPGWTFEATGASDAANTIISEIEVKISGCDSEKHSDCSCNGNHRRSSDFKSGGGGGKNSATYTFDACPGVYSSTRNTHQITIRYREVS